MGILIAATLFISPYLSNISAVQHKSEVKIGSQTVIVDVVSSEKEREQGLSGRESIGINEGMLFLFSALKTRDIHTKLQPDSEYAYRR